MSSGRTEGFRQLMIPMGFMMVFFLLISSAPPELFVSGESQYEADVPAYFRGMDIGSYSITYNLTVDDATLNINYRGLAEKVDFAFGGRRLAVLATVSRSYLQIGERDFIIFWSIYTEWLTFTSPEGVDRGSELTGAEMNLDYSIGESWIKYRISRDNDPGLGFDCLIGFNTSVYSSPHEAFVADALVMFLGMGFDDLYTTFNVWTMLGELMSFTSPDIPYPLNIVIPAFIYANLIWALLIVFTKLIPGLG